MLQETMYCRTTFIFNLLCNIERPSHTWREYGRSGVGMRRSTWQCERINILNVCTDGDTCVQQIRIYSACFCIVFRCCGFNSTPFIAMMLVNYYKSLISEDSLLANFDLTPIQTSSLVWNVLSYVGAVHVMLTFWNLCFTRLEPDRAAVATDIEEQT